MIDPARDRLLIATKIRWHRWAAPNHYGQPYWYAEIDSIHLAEAMNTSQTGSENYPWDWHLTDAGVSIAGDKAKRHSGVSDSLRSAKSAVLEALAPR